MKFLNLGCGAVRPPDPWVNLDSLRTQLMPGTPERINLDKEPNYVEHDLDLAFFPFEDNTFDGILCSHVVEHFDCQKAVGILKECRRVLKPTVGVLVVSVPNAEYFLSVKDRDTRENAPALFGEPICPDEPWHTSFFDYALFYHQHKQILTPASLDCLLIRAGLHTHWIEYSAERYQEIEKFMNRRKFSIEICAVK